MPSLPPSDPMLLDADFLETAVAAGLLTADAAREIERDVVVAGGTAREHVLRRGLLDMVQFDIIETLLRPRDAIPGYEVLAPLGHGGMGVVYRARQVNLDRLVAIKTILVSRMTDASSVTRFEQEARTVARLRHPHIVQAFDFGRHEGRLFFVMEYLEGEDVEKLLARRGALDEATAWGLARQAAAGLAHAAELNIVHRDIKPANLLLVDPPAGYPLPPGMPLVKIADFGLAFLTDEVERQTRLTTQNTTVGSPHYMAPEQLAGEPVDARADIYALGATLFEMLAGRPPFGGRTITQLVTQKLATDPPPLQSIRPVVSAASSQLVAAMLSRLPSERIGDYRTLLAEIDRLLPTLSTLVDPTAETLTRPVPAPSLAETLVLTRPPTATHAVLPTVALPAEPAAGAAARFSRRRLLAGGAVLGLAAGGVYFGWPRAPAAPPRQSLAPVRVRPLFEGKSLNGWITRSGSWLPGLDDEKASVIVGTKGVILRKYAPPDGSDLPANHRISLLVAVNEASAAELHFNIAPSPDHDAPRAVLRLTRDAAEFGERARDAGPFRATAPAVPLPVGDANYRAIAVEYQAGHWWLLVDEQPLASGPRTAVLPEFRLAVEPGPGPAWFSDILFEELASGATSS